MKKVLLLFILISGMNFNLSAQFNCCPDLKATAELQGCGIEFCFTPVSKKGQLCEGDITFLYTIKDASGQTVAFQSTGQQCFLFAGVPGETYTISGFVYYPWACTSEYQEIQPATITIPEDCDYCVAPYNIECNIVDGQMSISWDGPEIVRSYQVEIQTYVEGVDCCEGNINFEEEDYYTLDTYISDVSMLTNFNCFVMRITTICDFEEQESSEWICFQNGDNSCPEDTPIPFNGGDFSDSRNESSVESGISIFPNPTSDMLTLEGDNLKKGNILSIYNSLGLLVSTEQITSEKRFSKNISYLPPSNYIVVISSVEGGVLSQERLVKM